MKTITSKYIPLTFISSEEAIKSQIINTIIFRFILLQYQTPKPLGSLIQNTQYGYTASAKSTGNSKLLRITDIKEGEVDWNTVPFCDCNKVENYELKTNDILVARTGGTTGKSFIIKNPPQNAVYASYLIRIRVDENNNPHFINAFFNNYSYWSQISTLKGGAAQPNVNAKKLTKLLIPVCPKDIQDEIVAFLNNEIKCPFPELEHSIQRVSSLFEKNNKLKFAISNQQKYLTQLHQAILQEAIQGKLVPQNPNDEPASVLLERIKAEKAALVKAKKIKKEKPLPPISEEEIPFELPEGWVWCRLGDITTLLLGGFSYKSTSYVKNSKNQVIRLGNVKNDDLLLDAKPVYIDEELAQQTLNYQLKENDLLITMTGTRSKRDYCYTLLVNKKNLSKKNLFLNQRVGCFRFSQNVNLTFINYALKTSNLLNPIFETATGSANQANIGSKGLKMMLFPLPPFSEQNRIATKIETLLTLCDNLSKQVERSQADAEVLMQAVLQEAFGGG